MEPGTTRGNFPGFSARATEQIRRTVKQARKNLQGCESEIMVFFIRDAHESASVSSMPEGFSPRHFG
jgi:hypothetical protein